MTASHGALRLVPEGADAFWRNVEILGAVAEATTDAVFLKDLAGRYRMINSAGAAVFGRLAADVIGRDDRELFPAADAERIRALDAAVVASGVPSTYESEVVLAGVRRTFFTTKGVLRDELGRVVGLLGISRDVTARREVERLKDEFISTVSHELRTPLTSIRGALALLRSGAVAHLPPDALSLLAVAERNTLRLIGLVNDILDLDRLDAGRIDLRFEPVAVGDLVERAIEAVRGLAEERRTRFRREPAPYVVHGDAGRLEQVLVNLLSNAVKFSPEGAVVDVLASEEAGFVTVRVIDRGRGVPQTHRDLIFERFRQVDASDARLHGGTGLGLAISKALVERHGGAIGVEGREGEGSTFWFRVPAAEGRRPAP